MSLPSMILAASLTTIAVCFVAAIRSAKSVNVGRANSLFFIGVVAAGVAAATLLIVVAGSPWQTVEETRTVVDQMQVDAPWYKPWASPTVVEVPRVEEVSREDFSWTNVVFLLTAFGVGGLFAFGACNALGQRSASLPSDDSHELPAD